MRERSMAGRLSSELEWAEKLPKPGEDAPSDGARCPRFRQGVSQLFRLSRSLGRLPAKEGSSRSLHTGKGESPSDPATVAPRCLCRRSLQGGAVRVRSSSTSRALTHSDAAILTATM